MSKQVLFYFLIYRLAYVLELQGFQRLMELFPVTRPFWHQNKRGYTQLSLRCATQDRKPALTQGDANLE